MELLLVSCMVLAGRHLFNSAKLSLASFLPRPLAQCDRKTGSLTGTGFQGIARLSMSVPENGPTNSIYHSFSNIEIYFSTSKISNALCEVHLTLR